MSIYGQSSTANIFEYCTKFLICVRTTKLWDPAANQCDPNHPEAGAAVALHGPHRELIIPSFQRGIEWSVSDLQSCIDSQSMMLGIAVIGQVSANPQSDYLLDGLQRFSAFTSLLAILDERLFPPPTSQKPNPLKLHPDVLAAMQPIYLLTLPHSGLRPRIHYNDVALLNLNRQAVSTTYVVWRTNLAIYLDRIFNKSNADFLKDRSVAFIKDLADFLAKPLFVQELHNFPTMASLLQTFKGLNTIRVELTAADVCRSTIVDGMMNATSTPQKEQQILHVDNRFNTDLLTNTGRIKKPHSPLIKVLEGDWESNGGHFLVPSIFAQPPIAADIAKECDELLDWLSDWVTFQSQTTYASCLADIGDNPYVATLLYYFHHYKALGQPLTQPPDAELHQIVMAYVRRSLDGTVGDTLPITKKAGRAEFRSLNNFLDAINPPRSGSRAAPVVLAWLRNALDGINGTASAQIVFNATLLPPRHGANSVPLGSPFTPVDFGKGANKWQVDHLIPDNNFSSGTIGVADKDTLRNLCPIIGSDNGSYKAMDCSGKLNTSAAYYATYLSDPRKCSSGTQPHPFINALLTKQGVPGGDKFLNDKAGLSDSVGTGRQKRCYGDERLTILSDLLVDRL